MTTTKTTSESKKRVIAATSDEAQKLISANDIISKFAENTSGLLKTAIGTKKASIYKEHLFANMSDGDKKKLRKKFRNMLYANCLALVGEKNQDKINRLVKSFDDLYNAVYKVNDYSLASICSENLSTEKKDILIKALAIIKKSNNA